MDWWNTIDPIKEEMERLHIQDTFAVDLTDFREITCSSLLFTGTFFSDEMLAKELLNSGKRRIFLRYHNSVITEECICTNTLTCDWDYPNDTFGDYVSKCHSKVASEVLKNCEEHDSVVIITKFDVKQTEKLQAVFKVWYARGSETVLRRR